MTALDATTLAAWRDNLPNTPTMNAHAYALLRGILAAAAKRDPRITPPAIPGAAKAKTRHKVEPATLAELATIVENMPDRHRLAVLLMSWCALRFGEVTELRRQDVDLRRGKLRIRRAVVLVEGERIVSTPKSAAGVRDVTIPPHLVPIITDHLERFAQPGPSGLLFPADHGGHLSQSTLNGKPGRRRIIKGRIINEPVFSAPEDFERQKRNVSSLVRPFVFRKYLDFNAISSLTRLHEMIRAETARRELARGGEVGGHLPQNLIGGGGQGGRQRGVGHAPNDTFGLPAREQRAGVSIVLE